MERTTHHAPRTTTATTLPARSVSVECLRLSRADSRVPPLFFSSFPFPHTVSPKPKNQKQERTTYS